MSSSLLSRYVLSFKKYSQTIFLLIHSIYLPLTHSSGHFDVTLSHNTPIPLRSLSALMFYSSNRHNAWLCLLCYAIFKTVSKSFLLKNTLSSWLYWCSLSQFSFYLSGYSFSIFFALISVIVIDILRAERDFKYTIYSIFIPVLILAIYLNRN